MEPEAKMAIDVNRERDPDIALHGLVTADERYTLDHEDEQRTTAPRQGGFLRRQLRAPLEQQHR